MTISVSAQAFTFLCSVIGGIAIALIYDIFRIKRKAFKTGKFMTYVEDLLFWLLVAIVMFSMVYYSNEGELRSYLFLGAFIGVIFYALLFSKAVMNSSLFIINILRKIFKAVFFIVSYPIKLLFRLLAIPLRISRRFAGRSLRSIRKTGRNRLASTAIWRRAFKNMRKKI
jgi:spore cortex biosynthesis protein YabQ